MTGTDDTDRDGAGVVGKLDDAAFLALADRFIEVANRENERVGAPELQMVFLWAASRYAAFVGKSVMGVADVSDYHAHMVEVFGQMLRDNLSDPSLDPPA